MVWDARLLPATFRGVPFFVETHEASFGRNVVGHEPVDRDATFAEDVGKKGDQFSIEAHVLGDNYFFLRDALINAFKNSSAGILSHPYLGIKVVNPVTITVREDTKEGRVCRMTMTFVESGNPFFGFLSVIDTVTQLATDAVAVVAAVQTAVSLAVKVAELPGALVFSASSLVIDFADQVIDDLRNYQAVPEDKTLLKRKLEDLKASANDLIGNGDTAEVAAQTDAIMVDLKTIVEEPPDRFTIDISKGRDDQLSIFEPLLRFDGGADDIPETTPQRTQEKANAEALTQMIQQLALARLTEVSVGKEYTTRDDAINQRNFLIDSLEDQLQKATDDEVFQTLSTLKQSMIDSIPLPNADLSSTRTIQLDTVCPSIVLSYDLYEDVAQEQDLLDLNDVRKPTFMTGTLKVLTSG